MAYIPVCIPKPYIGGFRDHVLCLYKMGGLDTKNQVEGQDEDC